MSKQGQQQGVDTRHMSDLGEDASGMAVRRRDRGALRERQPDFPPPVPPPSRYFNLAPLCQGRDLGDPGSSVDHILSPSHAAVEGQVRPRR